MQEATTAVSPGLCLSLLPQQQGPAAESPEAQIQVLWPQEASGGREERQGRGVAESATPTALREVGGRPGVYRASSKGRDHEG